MAEEEIQMVANEYRLQEINKKISEKTAEENICDTPEYLALEKKRQELFKEKVRMQDQKRMINTAKRREARGEHLRDEVIKAVKEAIPTKPLISYEKYKTDNSQNEAALLLSDWHIGQNTHNRMNVFNDTELRNRILQLIVRTQEYCKLHKVKKLHIFALGDLVNGLIHVTTRINNEENVVQQTVKASVKLTEIIETLSTSVPEVHVYFSRGNHDRINAKMKENIDEESFFDLVQYIVAEKFAGRKEIICHENKEDPEIVIAEIAGHLTLAEHGHKDKPQKAAQRLNNFLRTSPDFIFLGHYHSGAELEENGTEVIVNGSLCGTDAFASSLRKNSQAVQKLMIINPAGRLCTYNIALNEKYKGVKPE